MSKMIRFAILNRHGLRFHMFALDRRHACAQVARMLGKRSVPEYISVFPA